MAKIWGGVVSAVVLLAVLGLFVVGRGDSSEVSTSEQAVVSQAGLAEDRSTASTLSGYLFDDSGDEETASGDSEPNGSRVNDQPKEVTPFAASCDGAPTKQISPPAGDLAAIVEGDAPGTCYQLAAGEYRFSDVFAKDGMSFIGDSFETTTVNGSGKSLGFYGNASNVTIVNIDFRDFDVPLHSNPQGQGAIMGATGIWDWAENAHGMSWRIDSVSISGGPGSGIVLGDNFTVTNSEFFDNDITGVAGFNFNGGLLANNKIYNNSSGGAPGASVNDAGVKVVFVNAEDPQQTFTVQGNEVWGNDRIGIWCDLECVNIDVIENTVHAHSRAGIFFEISRGGRIIGNLLYDNHDGSDFLSEWNSGAITVADTADVLVDGNTIDGTRGGAGLVIQQTSRPKAGETWLLDQVAQGRVTNLEAKNITFSNNTLIDVPSVGASHGESASNKTNYDTFSFTGNDYSQSPGIELWFNRTLYSESDWQSQLGFS